MARGYGVGAAMCRMVWGYGRALRAYACAYAFACDSLYDSVYPGSFSAGPPPPAAGSRGGVHEVVVLGGRVPLTSLLTYLLRIYKMSSSSSSGSSSK